MFKREFRQDVLREGYSKLLKKKNDADLELRKIKNGQSLFDKDLMTDKYSNPYLQDPQMRASLINYIEQTMPSVVGNPNLNRFEENIKPS